MKEKNKQRIQLDLATEQVALMDTLSEQLALRSRADLLQQAFQVRFVTRPVKENGITLYFTYLQIQMITVYQYFK